MAGGGTTLLGAAFPKPCTRGSGSRGGQGRALPSRGGHLNSDEQERHITGAALAPGSAVAGHCIPTTRAAGSRTKSSPCSLRAARQVNLSRSRKNGPPREGPVGRGLTQMLGNQSSPPIRQAAGPDYALPGKACEMGSRGAGERRWPSAHPRPA